MAGTYKLFILKWQLHRSSYLNNWVLKVNLLRHPVTNHYTDIKSPQMPNHEGPVIIVRHVCSMNAMREDQRKNNKLLYYWCKSQKNKIENTCMPIPKTCKGINPTLSETSKNWTVQIEAQMGSMSALTGSSGLRKIISLPENWPGVADVPQELQLKIQRGHLYHHRVHFAIYLALLHH